jgi:hypothetical protein
MVPEEWPVSSPAVEQPGQPAIVAGGERLSAVMADFFLDPDQRLTEQERALIGALLDGLIGWIADRICSALPQYATAANDADGYGLRLTLSRAGLLQRRDLMGLLLRAADEERIAAVARLRFPEGASLLQRLIANGSAEVSAAAMELILARGRRRDRFGQPRLEYDDLPADLAASLANSVAAACRTMVVAVGGNADTDAELADAAGALVRAHDEGKGIGRLSMELATALSRAGMLDDDLLASALHEGDARILADSLALRAGIDADAAWDLLASGQMPLLVGMAGVPRRFAAELMAAIGDQLGLADPASAIAWFDRIDDSDVDQARQTMRLGRHYRDAIARLQPNG